MTAARILVADDNPLTLRFFIEALAMAGVRGAGASDGKAAIDRARESAFDLLLFDARMPSIGGAAALAAIRSQAGPSRNAIALATTADDDATTHALLLAAGFAEVLVKPIGLQGLRRVLERYLGAAPAAIATQGNENLDDRQALAAAGGDTSIVTALRDLFARELDALPAEFATYAQHRDVDALSDRLHRLDASAGFCGAAAVRQAGNSLRTALATQAWPDAAIDDFLLVCARVRGQLRG